MYNFLEMVTKLTELAERHHASDLDRPPSLTLVLRLLRALTGCFGLTPLPEHFTALTECFQAYHDRSSGPQADLIIALMDSSSFCRSRVLLCLKHSSSMSSSIEMLACQTAKNMTLDIMTHPADFATCFNKGIEVKDLATPVLMPGATCEFERQLIKMLVKAKDSLMAQVDYFYKKPF